MACSIQPAIVASPSEPDADSRTVAVLTALFGRVIHVEFGMMYLCPMAVAAWFVMNVRISVNMRTCS